MSCARLLLVIALQSFGAMAWQCHNYVDGQDNAWCQRNSGKTIDGQQYKWSGPDGGLCGGCWCCSRGAWQCHNYEDGQNNEMCKRYSGGTHNGIEYKWSGPDGHLCGSCWCCQRRRYPEGLSSTQGSSDTLVYAGVAGMFAAVAVGAWAIHRKRVVKPPPALLG